MNQKQVEVIDGFLPKAQFDKLQSEILGAYFSWYLNTYQVHPTVDSDPQHIHNFYDHCVPKSNQFEIIVPLIERINPATIRRIKANLVMRQSENVIGYEHIDFDNFKGKTAAFYVNSNNGGTKIGDQIIQSVENRIVIFDSDIYHSAVSCTDQPFRCVININFTEWNHD